MTVLIANQISCEKSDRQLFSQLDLHIASGQIFHLQGDNGAGKTSLLRILVGLSDVQDGKVNINGVNIHSDPCEAGEKLVYLGHKLALTQVMSATENLIYWAQQQMLSLTKAQILEVLDELELTGLEDVPIKHLSAGQQRKVGLAKLWLKPQANIWVLDEPFTALDVHMIKKLEHKMDDFVVAKGAIILTSHQALNLKATVTNYYLEYQW